MTDKERILMAIVTRIIPGLLYSPKAQHEEYVESLFVCPERLQPGDLVYANTSIAPNDFMVGFVDHVEENCVVIREIGSQRLCNYYNESFTRINKEKLGYEVLEGMQYKTWRKVLKAFDQYTRYSVRLKDIKFDDRMCTVEARMMFQNARLFEVSFPYTSKTTIKEIGQKLEEAEAESALKGGDNNA